MTDLETLPLGGQWGIAIFMIVLASWLVYRFLVPDRFREWRNAGLVQAFVIALYAEMYGFPLTIYLLSRYLPFDIEGLHFQGHLWATLLGYGPAGASAEMLLGYSLILLGFFMVVRGWHQIYRARKSGGLVTDGLYRYVRHPQYTGLFLLLFGQLVHWPTIPTVVLFPFIVWLYVRLARQEEKRMLREHGPEYANYMGEVPRFFPGKRQWQQLANEI